METDHLLLYEDLNRLPTPLEVDANLKYLESLNTATTTAVDAAVLDANLAKEGAELAQADTDQSRLDAATSAAQALAAKNLAVSKADEAAASLDGLQGIRPDLASIAPGKGAALVGFIQNGDDAVGRSVQDKLREVVTVTDFGADASGATDCTSAVLKALAYAKTLPLARLHFPAGTFWLASLTSPLALASNLTISGDGMDSTTLKWNDGLAGSPQSLFAGAGSAISNVTLRDFHIRGRHDVDYTNTSHYPLLLSQVTGLRIKGLKITYSRTMGMAVRSSTDVDVSDCVVQYCARDGINTAGCNYVRICDNRVEFCDDDGIGAHSQIYDVADRGYVISGNLLRFCQGIRALGAISMAITGNTIEFCMAQGISVQSIGYTAGALEGITASVGISIVGNTIKNCIDRAAVDGLNTNAPYIFVGGTAGQAGGLAVIPGENNPATGTVISPYPYFGNTKNADPTQPIPGNYMIVVQGNTLIRDIPDSGVLSALGYGQFYVRSGPHDANLTSTYLRQNGILFASGISKGVLITGNTFMGIGPALALSATTKLRDVLFNGNVIYDCSAALSVSASNTFNHGCTLLNNIIDLDPFLTSTNRGANGTFLANGNPTAFTIQSSRGFAAIGNTFKNLCRISDFNPLSAPNMTGNGLYARGNIVECDPTGYDFQTTNKGVGQVPRGTDAFNVRIVDCDPASATFGDVLNNCPTELSAIPAAGKFLAGHFVRNLSTTLAGSGGSQYVVLGWLRVSVGSGHVLNTDWREMRCLTGT